MKVLLVEDCQYTRQNIINQTHRELGPEIIFIVAEDPHGVRMVIKSLPEIDIIFMDGYLKNNTHSLQSINRTRRAGFKGPMLAMSGDSMMRIRQCGAGCNYGILKDNVVEELKRFQMELAQQGGAR